MNDHLEYIERAETFLLEADAILHGSSFNNAKKLKISGILLSITIDHISGGFVLLKAKKYSSVSALLRIIYEGFIRAIWIKNCATENEIELFLKKDEMVKSNKKKYTTKELVEAVDKTLDANNIFTLIHTKYWSMYCSLTHGGIEQLNRNINKDRIEQNYSNAEIIFFSEFMFSCAMFAVIQVGEIIGKSKEIDDLINGYVPFLRIS